VRKSSLYSILLCAAVLFTGSAAYGGAIYQGADWSTSIDTNTRLKVCDEESDGHGVHADGMGYFGGGTTFDAHDPDGSGGRCGYGPAVDGVRAHRTVEEVSWQPDYRSEWHYHG
jgi:hypothetical protein